MTIQTVILAAGQGKRMHSGLPKVLHPLAGQPLLSHVIALAQQVASTHQPIVVYGHEGAMIRDQLPQAKVIWVEQVKQLGTGHAVLQALPLINEAERVLILYGDVPLVTQETVKRLIEKTPSDAVGVLAANVERPTGYGRIKRNAQQQVMGIIEEKDASAEEKLIKEVNSGIYLVPARYLKKWLPQIENKNAQQEFYLTDIISFAVRETIKIHTTHPIDNDDIRGVNDRIQLAAIERIYQHRQAQHLMAQGVTLADPARFDVRGQVTVGRDVFIDVGVVLEGPVTLGEGCRIGPYSCIRDSQLADQVEVKSHSVIEGATIAAQCVIGPFARLRPGTVLSQQVHVGNFVEIKKSQVGEASKINHLSYVGDSDIGCKVNVGAGTITCNYDGVNKHKTIIGDYAFIGSGTELVAPVTVGAHATIGAGSTITQDAPPKQLTIARTRQQTIQDWKRPEKPESN